MDEGTLNDLLECSVCFERLDTSSKVLPCQHTFCRKCLDEIVQKHKELRCPECRVLITIRVDELPPNVLLMRILEGMRNAMPKRQQQSQRGGGAIRSGMQVSSPPPPPPIVHNIPTSAVHHHHHHHHGIPHHQLNSNKQPNAAHLILSQHHQPYAKALYDYGSKEAGDLTFKRGDTIILRKRIDNHWYQGECGGKQGVFPLSYVQIITPVPSHLPQCKALYDFRMTNDEEEGCLVFNKGDIINVIRRVDENWAEGKLDGRIGIFPLAFVELNNLARSLMKLSTNAQPGPSRVAPPTPTTDDSTPLIPTDHSRTIVPQQPQQLQGQQQQQPITLPSLITSDSSSTVSSSGGSSSTTTPNVSSSSTSSGSSTAPSSPASPPPPMRNPLIVPRSPAASQLLLLQQQKPDILLNSSSACSTPQRSLNSNNNSHSENRSPSSNHHHHHSNNNKEKRHSFSSLTPPHHSTNTHRHSAEIVSGDSHSGGSSERSGNSRRAAVPFSTNDVQLPAAYTALYPYKPQKADELELRKGGIYMVTERCQDGWFKGTSNRTQKCGVFPGNYVILARSSQSTTTRDGGLVVVAGGGGAAAGPTVYTRNGKSVSSQRHQQQAAASNLPPELPPRAISPASIISSSWHGQQDSASVPLGRSSSATMANGNSQHFTLVAASSNGKTASDKNKERKEKGTVSLMRRLTSMKRSKSPPPSSYSMDNPVFEDTSAVNVATAHPVHVRSGSCPSQLLQIQPVEHHRMFGSTSQRLKHKERPSVLTHNPRTGENAAPGSSGSSPDIRHHRKSNSLDAGNRATTKTGNSSSGAQTVRERFRCIAPYPPNSEYELELQVNDIIYVHKKRDDGWYKGTQQRTGRTGLFPASFVENF